MKLGNNRKNIFDRIDWADAIAAVLLILFLLSLIPIFSTSRYAHPLTDDYSYSALVHHSIENGESVFGILYAVWETVLSFYNSWQGTFSAIALFSLQPGVFGDQYYCLTTFIMIGSLVISTIALAEAIFTKCFGYRKVYSLIIAILVLFQSIQYVPDIAQTYYWYNGSVYYTFFYSISLLLFVSVICLIKSGGRIKYLCGACFLAIVVGGGNYSTGLLSSECLFLIMLYCRKIPRVNKRLGIVFLALLCAFIINMLAPGNEVRADKLEGLNAISAIKESFINALTLIGNWTRFTQIFYIWLILPFLMLISSKIKFRFQYPGLAIGIMIGLFASQLTPPLYAMDSIGDGRQIDLYYYTYYLLITGIAFYCIGWVSKRNAIKINGDLIQTVYLKITIPISVMIFAVWGFYELEYIEEFATTVQIVCENKAGTVDQYDKEYQDLLNKMESDEENVCVHELRTVPSFFERLYLKTDSTYWTNEALAEYFGKKQVTCDNPYW